MSVDLFWQYPVITEKIFNDQNSANPDYIGIPWATILDKRLDAGKLVKMLGEKIDVTRYNITCCQHIHFRKLISEFKSIGIKVVYTPHKVHGEDQIDGIFIKPCPLYAVNVEDQSRNMVFDVDFHNIKRTKLYTFQGAYQQGYLTNIREQIFKLPKMEDVEIRFSGDWHFNQVVYSDDHQNKSGEYAFTPRKELNTTEYNKLLLDSVFSLCPSGSGPNSIRLWESLATGTIPVVLSDKLELPEHPLWPKAIIRTLEKDVGDIDYILRSISKEEIVQRRINCLQIYAYFRSDFLNSKYDSSLTRQSVVHYCCGTYQSGDFGGVARFDHCLKSNFPNVVSFQGPRHKNELTCFLRQCKVPPIVITDNHLACDVPNEFQTIVINHGCAKKTAEHVKQWDPYWKTLCVEGQQSMLDHRHPESTVMVPICDSIQRDFTKHFHTDYTKFKIMKVLHYSFMDETNRKTYGRQDLKVKVLTSGDDVIKELSCSDLSEKYYFQRLNADGRFHKTVAHYIASLQRQYVKSDIFLNLSKHLNSVYEVLDAAVCGVVIVSTNIGICLEMPKNCFVVIDYDKGSADEEYVDEKLRFALENQATLTRNAFEWVKNTANIKVWINQFQNLINGEM